MKNTVIFLFILFSIHTQAQKEAWHWYFGNNVGIDFSSGIPVLTNGSLSTYEGSATISDSSGSLLFYTDGRVVYNRGGLLMPNGYGLLGDSSSTQSSLIVPLPGSSSIYYIFTVDFNQNGLSNGNGFQYSIVDMSLNNGYGDVTTKNVLIRLPVYEKLTAIKHSNNSDYWILINDWQSDAIYAYLLSPSGLNLSPVISPIGPFHMGNYSNTGGYFKASKQGNKIALALWAKNSFDICDFNNATGIASNHITVQSNDMINTYGIEFSPNGKYLYGTNMEPPCHIYQFDLTSGTPVGILNTRVTLDSSNTLYHYDALQSAPDGKIYCAHKDEYYLGVIQNPDSAGTQCNYTDSGFSTGTHLSMLGLPNFPSVGRTVTTGISDLADEKTITLQPNPAHNELTIHSTTLHENELVSVFVWNVLGEIVFFEKFKWTGDKTIRIDELPRGMYSLGLKSNASYSNYANSIFIKR